MSEVKNKEKEIKYYSGQYWCSGSYYGYPYYHNDGNCLRYSGNGPYCKLYRFSQGRDTETHKTGAFHAAGK